MTPTKVKELAPHKREYDPRCVFCNPKDAGEWIREDEIWSHCHTNGLHAAHPKGGGRPQTNP